MFGSPSQGIEEKTESKGREPDSSSEFLHDSVDRILACPAFQRSHRLSQLLRYLAEHTATGDVEGLKESVIGQRVFGRPANYSAAEDNIVRANIRQLRLKIDEYYAGPGAGDPWRVALPKGSYGLVLEQSAGAAVAPVVEAAATRSIAGRSAWKTAATGAACGVAAFLALMVVFPRRSAAITATRPAPARCLLGLLAASPGQRLLVVVPDADVQLYQRLTGRTVSLQDYLARQFTRPEAFSNSPELAASTGALFHHFTTQSFVLGLIPKFAQAIPPAQLSVRHPGTLAVSDFEKDNALLISGPYGDPWVRLFDAKLNFQINVEADKRAHITNRSPSPGEQKAYDNYSDATHTEICYARIAYLPGLSASNRVLLAGGPHTASTDAACRFLTRPDSLDEVCRLFHVSSPTRLPWFELLVEARALGNSPWSMRILAHRVVSVQNPLQSPAGPQ